MPPVGQTFTLLPDFRMTRRKRYHILLDLEREHVMAAINLTEVFEHVLDADRRSIIVETDTQNYILTINRLPGPPGAPPGAPDAAEGPGAQLATVAASRLT